MRFISIVVFVAMLSGCASNLINRIDQPQQAKLLTPYYTVKNKEVDQAAYNSAMSSANYVVARAQRDLIVQSIWKEIDSVYGEFEAGLYANKAGFELETDIAELLISTATTLTGAPRAKTNLSALLTTIKGSRLSIDKNVFAEKTYGALVSQMRANRSNVSASIHEKLARLDVLGYSLTEAEADLGRLFRAGTIHEALLQITTETGAAAKIAKENEDKKALIKLDPATAKELASITSIRFAFNALARSNDVVKGRKILTELVPSTPATLSDEQVWMNLDAEIRKGGDKSYLPKLAAAFGQ